MGQGRIEVKVVPFADRPALQLQWRDPVSGERKTSSARTSDADEAERKRADLEYELNHGLHREGSRVSWERFRECFEAEYLPGLREGTRKVYGVIFDHFEEICQPAGLDSITARTISQFVVGLRAIRGRGPSGQNGMQPSTITARLALFKAALGWTVKQKMMDALPAFPTIKVPKRKPQPVSPEHYERLLAAADEPFLRAFVACGWLAGLRLSEAQKLSWEPSQAVPWLDFGRQRIWFPAEFVKAVEDQWLPIAPELRQLLLALSRDNGPHVFPWHALTETGASYKVIALARRAKVPLTMRTLRRGFGCYYAGKVPAQTLQRLLRHANIATTLGYYCNTDLALEEAILGQNANSSPTATPVLRAEP